MYESEVGGTLHSLFAKYVSKLMTSPTLFMFILIFLLKWCLFYYVNDNKDVDVKCPQTMRYIFCSNSLVFLVTLKFKKKKA
jgi:hypothetical protein